MIAGTCVENRRHRIWSQKELSQLCELIRIHGDNVSKMTEILGRSKSAILTVICRFRRNPDMIEKKYKDIVDIIGPYNKSCAPEKSIGKNLDCEQH